MKKITENIGGNIKLTQKKEGRKNKRTKIQEKRKQQYGHKSSFFNNYIK